jgi:putative ABC transport system ATP-binding protein
MGLKLEQLRKSYLAPDGTISSVIDIESLALADGEQVALVGTSGSGKTTLLHLIAGILAPDAGRILFDFPGDGSADLARMAESQRDVFRGQNIGYIFQTHHLLGGFIALENVLLGMSFTGRKHDVQWATHLLTEVGLAHRLDYRPAKLSLGQQQRVAVARALANRPKLVLADEPTGSLDSANAQQVLDLIRKLCSEVAATLLVVSHDLQITGQFPRVLKLTDINRAQAANPR